MFFNPVFPNALFIYPLKTSENLKMARVVNLKLVFTDYFFHNLVVLIKLYKIWYLN